MVIMKIEGVVVRSRCKTGVGIGILILGGVGVFVIFLFDEGDVGFHAAVSGQVSD